MTAQRSGPTSRLLPQSAVYMSAGTGSAFASSPPVEGDPRTYAYHPKIALALGSGFNPSDVTKYCRPALTFTERGLDAGTPGFSMESYYVRNENELNFAMNVDSKAEASFLDTKATKTTTFKTGFALKQSSITVVMRVSADFGRWGLDAGAGLIPEAKALLSNGRKFAETFGSRYVIAERRGAIASATITLSDVDQKAFLNFSSEFTAAGGWGPLKGNATNKFAAELKMSAKQSRATVSVSATGGTGPAALADAIKELAVLEKDPMGAIYKALSAFLATFSKSNASPVEYSVSSMEDWGWDPTSLDPWTDFQEAKLRKLVNEYRRATNELEIAEEINRGVHPLEKFLPAYFTQKIAAAQPQLEAYVADLAVTHKHCKENATPTGCNLPPSQIHAISDWMLDYLEPPKFVIEVVGLTPDQTRIVINTPRGQRLDVAKGFNPTLAGFAATYSFKTPYPLLAQRYIVQYDDGKIDRGTWTPYSTGTAGIWVIEGDPSGYEDEIHRVLSTAKGAWKATIGWEITDLANRMFRVGFLDVDWEIDRDGKMIRYDFTVLL